MQRTLTLMSKVVMMVFICVWIKPHDHYLSITGGKYYNNLFGVKRFSTKPNQSLTRWLGLCELIKYGIYGNTKVITRALIYIRIPLVLVVVGIF
jgi:hypothetical protein